jgi:Kef-type K+ transport system membrane component KefB
MTIVRWRTLLGSILVLVFVNSSSLVLAATEHAGGINTSSVISVLLALAVVLLAAKIGGDIMVRLRQPEVLGELIVGIILGNLTLFGIQTFHFLRQDLVLEILSELGVILLLFEVGLHTTIPDMMRVGGSALLVAILGVITGAWAPISFHRQTASFMSIWGPH